MRSNVIPLGADDDVVVVKQGKIEDFHLISPETDPENLRMVGALAEMLFEQVKKSFRVDSLLVIAQNEDFRIAMFPTDDGITVWKTNLEVREILLTLDRAKHDRGKPVKKAQED